MDLEYDPKREAVAAMKLAAQANGAERHRWITAALAWSELTRLGGAAEDNLREERPTRQFVTGVQGAAPAPPPSKPLGSRSGGNAMPHPLTRDEIRP
ncbi:hypothetical protein FXB41_08950 [Bradyrhizobium canariense]|nr:hypothetical protein [Bradyrhizobium canariense]